MGLIAIGDIHGCARTLDALLTRLAPNGDDHLVFVGDYVDRGPDSRGVIDRLLQLEQSHDCTFLRGNHEAMMLDAMSGVESGLWYANGGRATLDSYPPPHTFEALPVEHVAFLQRTQPFLETDDFVFVHGGLRPELSVADNLAACEPGVLYWTREHLRVPATRWEKTVVCGHTPMERPLNRPDLIAIDTGAVYAGLHPALGRLTAVRLPEREFVSVQAQG